MNRLIAGALSCALLFAVATPACADPTPPDPQYSSRVVWDHNVGGTPTEDLHYSTTAGTISAGNTTATMSPGTPTETPYAKSIAYSAPGENAGAFSTMWYWVQVSGAYDANVDLILLADLYATISGNAGAPPGEPDSGVSASARVSLNFFQDQGMTVNDYARNFSDGVYYSDITGFGQTLNYTQDFLVHPGEIFQVRLDANISSYVLTGAAGGYAYGMATADPYFHFSGSSPGYTLTFSPGVSNVPSGFALPGAVPEPATWAMMLGGFALAGGMLRRRRTATPVPALA